MAGGMFTMWSGCATRITRKIYPQTIEIYNYKINKNYSLKSGSHWTAFISVAILSAHFTFEWYIILALLSHGLTFAKSCVFSCCSVCTKTSIVQMVYACMSLCVYVSVPWRTGGDHRDAPVLCGWRLPSSTWNHWTSPWMKQLTWLRIVHSGEWCPCLVLCTHSGDWQKWVNDVCLSVCLSVTV